MYDSCAHAHTCEQFLNLRASIRLDFVFVYLSRFAIYVIFVCVSLDQFIPVLLASVVLGLVASVTSVRSQ